MEKNRQKEKREKKKEWDVNDWGEEEKGKKDSLTTTFKYDSNIKNNKNKIIFGKTWNL